MIYLIIMFTVCAVGIATLWVQQKRERAHLASSERFLTSLQKIAPEAPRVQRHRPARPRRVAGSGRRARRPMPRTAPGRPIPMDPARREAARRRVEARRRAQARAGRARRVS